MKKIIFIFLIFFITINCFSQEKRDLSFQMNGAINNSLGDYEGAIIELNKAISLYPDDYFAYCFRGESKLNLNDTLGAMKDFNKSIEIEPSNYPNSYFFRAKAKYQLQDYRGAIVDLDKAIDIFTQKKLNSNTYFAQSYYLRGCAKLILKQYDEGC